MMPRKIAFGENVPKEFEYPTKSLIITTTTPDVYNRWLEYMQIRNYEVYDKVTPDPAIETIETIRRDTRERIFQHILVLVEEALWMYVGTLAK